MARLQILELPEVFVGEASETPFVLVLDQVNDELAEDITRWHEDDAKRIGARQVLCFPGTIDIPANDVPGVVDTDFKASVETWATGTNETIARLIDAINGKTKRPKSSPVPRNEHDVRSAGRKEWPTREEIARALTEAADLREQEFHPMEGFGSAPGIVTVTANLDALIEAVLALRPASDA